MGFRTFVRWVRSAEGPFSRKPKWLKEYITKTADILGVGLYVMPEWQRSMFGQYVALHKEACLFLAHKVDLELQILSRRIGADHQYTDYVLERLFGADGYVEIEKKFNDYRGDEKAVELAQDRVVALVDAAFGTGERLEAFPDFADGLQYAAVLVKMFPSTKFDSDLERAFHGLHYKYFSSLFTAEEFGEWLETQLKGRYAAEALVTLSNFMDQAANGSLSGRRAAKMLGKKFDIS